MKKSSLFLLLSLLPALPGLAADAGFTLGTPRAPRINDTTDAARNAWLASNAVYSAMAVVAPAPNGFATSAATVAGVDVVRLAANESGFAIERTKPEYYLGDQILPPDGVDWSATYDRFVQGDMRGLLFDAAGRRVFVTKGGTVSITWVLADGTETPMTYVTSASCSGRPRRIYWTDAPFNSPAVDLAGKFVRFFGADELLVPKFSAYTNTVSGITQVISNRVVSGLVLDDASHMLYAYGELQGQVVMAYYDTGTFEHLLHVQAVEICRPDVNVMPGWIGKALRPDGRGYDTTGLRAQPTIVLPTDDRGEYLYQHKGNYSYSPKSGNVYPLRPTTDCRWNAEIYWMETDEMEVQWPFELDHYECDWPEDTTVFVRGDVDGDFGRDIYIPTDYSPVLMSYQEPEGHARAPSSDGTFTTTGPGHSLLRLTTEDDIWFLPIRSVMRSDPDFFTLAPQEIAVGRELRMRDGSAAGTSAIFSPDCDPESPGYIYEANSDRIWNAGLYAAPRAAEASSAGVSTNAIGSISSGEGTNSYPSVIYAVTANVPGGEPRIEVWWNTTFQQDGMAKPITIPSLPQVYAVRWPEKGEAPQIVIASQLGSACESVFQQNNALVLERRDSSAELAERAYFPSGAGTAMFWMRASAGDGASADEASLLDLRSPAGAALTFDWRPSGATTNLVASAGGAQIASAPVEPGEWHHVALAVSGAGAELFIDGEPAGSAAAGSIHPSLLGASLSGRIGASGDLPARAGVEIGELLFWNGALGADGVRAEMLRTHDGSDGAATGCYAFHEGRDLEATGTDYRTFFEKVMGIPYRAFDCGRGEVGPPALGSFLVDADGDTTPKVYAQNDAAKDGYNPNEEHGFVQNGGDGYVAWALRSDLNTDETSAPGVLVEYVKDGGKRMQWFDVVLTNEVYAALADNCLAGKAIPGPHPLDLFDDPWKPETYWEETGATTPAHRDRKGQLWARAAGTLTVHMYYPMQEGFAFPSLPRESWPEVGASVPWLSLLDKAVDPANVLSARPAAWVWTSRWPDVVPEMEIGRTLTVAASGLPEVWNAKSVAVVWPGTDAERDATALLFDPTVAQSSGFGTAYATVAAAVADLGIKTGAGGNATLRKGKWTFDGLPPSISGRFYLDTASDVEDCLRLVGEREDNAGGVSLLHVNVLNAEEREALRTLLDDTASDKGKKAWHDAIDALATKCVKPSKHRVVSDAEDVVDYEPRDHYALFTMGATNYVTIIENDSENERMNVADGDPISMHLFKVVPKYYTGRVVTREDPLNLLSQQLSVIYAEAFAGEPEGYVFEWRKCRPHADGSVPTDFDGEYTPKFDPKEGLTRFVIGAQGDTLANMVNTYYAMRYRAASTNSPAYAAMGYGWSDWTDPPALAEGWVQRVLNNVTPFAQRMRDLADNEAETAVSMIRQAGGPYEGDIALNQDNLTEVGLVQLYETILSKAESMSLQLEISDADANKQLQLAVARLADLYNLLGDEAYTDALNPTIGFGSNFSPGGGSGYALDYGALSSALFCFDNQVPTLLDEELALLRGRSGANAPSTRLSPYYNRLVWNFTRGMNAGEVAYAVNYDVSGNNKGVIDYSQAAEMFPQGHGDAYGHYLSALSGYYRLLRNPFFSWGEPAMGEMVVADSVLNVDYYDEAQFAKSAYNVARTALEVVDRTARKAYRDNGGASGAGYADGDASRNFGYGEWASRGGFGALCNWAVGNSILGEEPSAGRYWSAVFDGADSWIWLKRERDVAPVVGASGDWTLEFQLSPAAEQSSVWAEPLSIEWICPLGLYDDTNFAGFMLDATNALSFVDCSYEVQVWTNTVYSYTYTNETFATYEGAAPSARLSVTNEELCAVIDLWFHGDSAAPALPEDYDGFEAIASGGSPQPPDWSAEGWSTWARPDGSGTYTPVVDRVETIDYFVDGPSVRSTPIVQLKAGANSLIALRRSGGAAKVSVFDASGALVEEKEVPFDRVFRAEEIWVGEGYSGEAGEVRFWSGVSRSDAELRAKREYVSPLSDGLSVYLRTISPTEAPAVLADTAAKGAFWNVVGCSWKATQESGLSVAFDDEGLKRIDRGTVPELASLAAVVPQIQRKVDRMDAGLNPLGLAAGAIPFDLDPFGEGGGASHYEQIRQRAGVALANARKALDRAQESSNRMRLLQEAQTAQEDMLETAELEFKNKLIEYFGYPYEGDIGPGGSYPQGYDGPDIYHYAWMDPTVFGVDAVSDTVAVTVTKKVKPSFVKVFVPFYPSSSTESEKTLTFELSANGFVKKPAGISGNRRAPGKIQDALGDFICAYASLQSKVETCSSRLEDFENSVRSTALVTTPLMEIKFAAAEYGAVMNYAAAAKKVAFKCSINAMEMANTMSEDARDRVLAGVPHVNGVGTTVNIDPKALANATVSGAYAAIDAAEEQAMLAAKNSLAIMETEEKWTGLAKELIMGVADLALNRVAAYNDLRNLWYTYRSARSDMEGAYRTLLAAQAAVEAAVAEAERIIDERTLKRQQAVDTLTKMRYNEMFFRLERDNALSRYASTFDLAQKYAYLAAQAYDYETGLLAADPASGDAFLAEIVGARTPGEFSADGEPMATSGDGDGGLADILARLDANWLVLKPRLGINNPQRYATWFSLRRELYRIYPDERGDQNWKTALRKCVVEDLNAVPEFRHYCQPLSGSAAAKEPGIVIEFPSQIIYGYNFFGEESSGGDSPLDPTWYATHIAAAGIHFAGYDDATLTKTPTAYLVPVGEDRMRSPGAPETLLSWKVVDQTIPAPFAIGSTQLDDPDWTPLYDGATGGNDLGTRIRRHPSFRAYYGAKGAPASDAELDCTRLVGRSAWNTRWLLVIPAGAMNANREDAIDAFIDSVSDIRLGLKTYSASGN